MMQKTERGDVVMLVWEKRRKFIKQVTLGGIGLLTLRNSSSAWSYQTNEKLNIACIGVGGQGGGLVNLFAGLGENIVALCDVDEQHAANSFQKFPKAKRYHDFRKMLEEMHHQIDAVVVATPDHTHAVASVMAMKLGKHVFCEKPLTRTVYEARVMREVAAKQKVATQMGNQGTASEGLRRAVELVQAGVLGEVLEAHAWIGGGNTPTDRPKDEPPVPSHLQWDLWLGPAPYRPYHPAYHPFSWRNWRDFGTGVLGDFGCHIMNLAFMALNLDRLWKPDPTSKPSAPPLIRVEAEASEIHRETYSRWVVVRYSFLTQGNPPIMLTWYNGGLRPPQELLLGHPITDVGCLLVGTKGSLLTTDTVHSRFVLLPQNQFEGFQGPPPTLPRSPGHYKEWVQACKGGAPAMANFDYAGPLTEMVLLGTVAAQLGHPIEYEPISGKIVNCAEANRFLHREYRQGWSL